MRGAVDTARRSGEDRIVLRSDRGLGCGCRGDVSVRAGDLRRVRQADAAYAAGRYLCSLGVVDNPTLALVAYNCGNAGAACQAASAGYAQEVLATAASYTAPGAGAPSGVQEAAVSYAESQIGTPYVYGGATPQTGFDCSGLVVWAYGLAGVVVPRVANGDSAMVDAPYTGADVRVDTIPDVAGAAWGSGEVVLGAADPVAT